jgi:hypothetical protein
MPLKTVFFLLTMTLTHWALKGTGPVTGLLSVRDHFRVREENFRVRKDHFRV